MKRPDLSERNTKHGLSKHPIYRLWKGMKSRCTNKNATNYSSYGGRGILVCEKWINSFPEFLADMGERPNKNHTIERVDNDKGYSPDNCIWAIKKTQARNRRTRKNNKCGIDGVFLDARSSRPRWQITIGVDGGNIHIGYLGDFFEACCARKSAENKYWH